MEAKMNTAVTRIDPDAAPELLEALKAWDRFAQHCRERSVVVPLWASELSAEAALLTARAIAKAEGRS